MLPILVIILIALLVIVYVKKYEHFGLDDSIDKTDLLDMAQSFSNQPTVNVVGKELDDDLIVQFIKGDSENSVPMLEYPEEQIPAVNETSSLEEIEQVKQNYESLIESKTKKQEIKLKNLLYELQKINKLESKLECN
jgi:hypothetical protein